MLIACRYYSTDTARRRHRNLLKYLWHLLAFGPECHVAMGLVHHKTKTKAQISKKCFPKICQKIPIKFQKFPKNFQKPWVTLLVSGTPTQLKQPPCAHICPRQLCEVPVCCVALWKPLIFPDLGRSCTKQVGGWGRQGVRYRALCLRPHLLPARRSGCPMLCSNALSNEVAYSGTQ